MNEPGAPAANLRPYPAPMPEAVAVVLDALAAGDKQASKLARILPLLIVEAGKPELRDLIEYDAFPAGVETDHDGGNRRPWRAADPVVGKAMRPEWWSRLASAITSGALDAYTPKQVVEILLQPKG